MTGDIAINLQMCHATAMTGPEFLEAVAAIHASNGQDTNAAIFRQRAQEWTADRDASRMKDQQLQSALDQIAARSAR